MTTETQQQTQAKAQTPLFTSPEKPTAPDNALERLRQWAKKEIGDLSDMVIAQEARLDAMQEEITKVRKRMDNVAYRSRKIGKEVAKISLAPHSGKTKPRNDLPEGFVRVNDYLMKAAKGKLASSAVAAGDLARLGVLPSARQTGPSKLWIAKREELENLLALRPAKKGQN
jgi:hypothetical protein